MIQQEPWVKLGHSLLGVPSQKVVEAAGLDWEIEKQLLCFSHGNISYPVDREVVYRVKDGKPVELTTAPIDWNVVDHRQAFGGFLAASKLSPYAAGTVRKERSAWMICSTKQQMQAAGTTIGAYVLFTNPIQYGHSISAQPMIMFESTRASLVFRSTRLNYRKGGFEAGKVAKVVNEAMAELTRVATIADGLAKYVVENGEMEELIATICPPIGKQKKPVKAGKILHKFLCEKEGPFSLWDFVTAMAYTIDFLSGKNDDNRLNSAWYGAGRGKKLDAYLLATGVLSDAGS